MTPPRYELLRVRTRDGDETTVYLVRHDRRATRVTLRCFADPVRLDVWCRAEGHPEAMVAGFFVRDPYRPLGETRVAGTALEHEPIAAAWRPHRACLQLRGDDVVLAARRELGEEPEGDLVSAGPLLVHDGRVVDEGDAEGFSAGSAQFDSDITAERHPRAALGLRGGELIAVTCDGRRTGVDAGLSMSELAQVMVDLGAERAINLDGGGSATHVHCGHLLNRPYSDQDQPGPESRPVVTALALEHL